MDRLAPLRLAGLSPEARHSLITRSKQDISGIRSHVRDIIEDVRRRGDLALIESVGNMKEHVRARDLIVTEAEYEAALAEVSPKVLDALWLAAANIEKFHRAQLKQHMWQMEVSPGVIAGRLRQPIQAAGCYIPGGKAAYPSSALMTIIPAKVAGVETVVACTPPQLGLKLHPATICAARIAGADLLLKVGGPWAIAAMAFGTATCPKVHKIVGPGNKYVTAAKLLVYGEVAIDSPAGPSEVLILADETAEARFIALDMLAQA
ncbi:MAG: histidinol dehydrogenase, partial [Pseudomonadota bacterium]